MSFGYQLSVKMHSEYRRVILCEAVGPATL